MNRRDFFKLSTLFAAAMAVEASPILRAVATALENNTLHIIFYKVQERTTGNWKVKGTKYVDLAKTRFNHDRFRLESFEVLDIVDSSVANETKSRLWKEHGCKGIRWGGFRMEYYVENGKITGNINKQTGRIGNAIGTKESRQRGQRNSVIVQIKSGKLDKWRMRGTTTAAINKVARNNERKKKVYDIINYSPFTLDDVENIYTEHGMTTRIARRFFNDTKLFYDLGFSGHKTKLYQKI